MKLAVIPARGGSRRIPRKNIRPFAGQPMIAHTIRTAVDSGLFDRVIVSTDDEEIAGISRGFGAETPFVRPTALADDHTGTNAVVKHALQWFSERGEPFEFACCLYATAPFLQARFVQEGLEALRSSGKSFAFSVTTFAFPIQRALRITPGGTVEPLAAERMLTRSQDLEETYHDAGQFYWGRAEAFMSDAPLFSNIAVPVILPRYFVQDIDTLEDWQCAEHMHRALQLAGMLSK
ncbi:MAG: pseudaminic acid cytidylyltransferase [Caldimonas sp.]